MINFSGIRFKNILSVGDDYCEFNFKNNERILIMGDNGCGKSTLLDALTFVLYGVAFRKISKGNLVNAKNKKNMVVEISFRIGSHEYKIIRGISPNRFEFFIDRELQESAGVVSQQNQIIELLGMEYAEFSQVVILGRATYVPFLRLPIGDRRILVEKLLGVDEFSEILSGIRSEIKTNILKLHDLTKTADHIQCRIDDSTTHLEDLTSIVVDTPADPKSIKLQIKKNNDLIIKLQDKVCWLQKKTPPQSEVSNLISKNGTRITKLNTLCQHEESIIEFFSNNSSCSVCSQDILENHRSDVITTANKKIKKYTTGISKLDGLVTDAESAAVTFRHIDKMNSAIMKLEDDNKSLSSTEELIGTIETKREKTIQGLTSKISELSGMHTTTIEDYSMATTYGVYLDHLNAMAGDDGVKKMIISNFLPKFISLIHENLAGMGMNIMIELDHKFNLHNYLSLSEGQKLRVDLSVMLAWRSILKSKSSVRCNLLILDEVLDSSLDGEGVDGFMNILTPEDGTVIVISHTPDKISEQFDRKINVELSGGFTKIEEIK